MSDMAILLELINNDAMVSLQDEYDKKFVVLIEPDVPDSKVKIRNLPSDAMVIKVDRFRSPDAIFKGDRGECKRADYVIVSEKEKCILYIETKLTNDEEHLIVKQLKGAHCFIKYCQEIVRSFWEVEYFLKNYQNRFISFSHTGSINKQTIFTKASKSHDKPENAMKIAYPQSVQFNRLLAG